jgi:alpha-L-fucosidase
LKIKSLGTDSKYSGKPVKDVKLLGYKGKLLWKQQADGLSITCPAKIPFATSIVFKVE